ncbi:dTDP-glucose 4,6-dehydratase [Candidatus Saccharibacteria bacterium]|nr:dTDP-glucose 4,6-dehydratase [Candidatus Saccharibacteria bacterium]
MKLLVSGGAGFIGSNFVRYMAGRYPDYQLLVVDAMTYAADKQRLAALEDKITFHKADIADFAAMDKLLKDVGWVVNFAAHSHVDRSIADPGPFLRSNVIGVDVLARAAIKNKVKRFHHVSTDEVFGSLKLDSAAKFNEKTPYAPRSPYAASKAAGDHIIRAYGETYGLPYTITNCSNNYGPFDSPGRVIPVFISHALSRRPLPIYGKGQAVRDYLFVDDHCRAIDLVLHQGEIGETYCVGGGAQRSGVQIAEAILEALGLPKTLVEFVDDRPGHDIRYDIDAGYIKRALGWQPSVAFEEGLALTISWYKQNLKWLKTFEQQLDLMREQGFYKAKAAVK